MGEGGLVISNGDLGRIACHDICLFHPSCLVPPVVADLY